jgi:DNA-binding LacI/PurR family transcriptional regulator
LTLPATIHDVAKRAGVGVGTVSSVLNNSRPVSQRTRQRVLNAINELDFVPNTSGRRLSMGKTHSIGVVIPFFTIASQMERLRGVMSVIAGSDYDISLYTIETVPQRNRVLEKVTHRGHIDGLIIFSINPTNKDFQRISRGRLPVVLVESYHPELHSISLDDETATYQAVEYLISMGHTKIAYLGDYLDDPFGTYFSRNRYKGYCQALEQANLPILPEYCQLGWHDQNEARQLAHTLLTLPNPPTAVFVFSDEQAIGVLEAARDLNITVPGELSIIGYDDIRLAHFAQLTTVRQHLFESGVQGVELLLNLIEQPDLPVCHTKMPTELVVRRTTAPVNI